MRIPFLNVICFAVLCVILTLGLWPFHSPKNEVTWLGSRNGLRFGRYGTAISSGALRMTSVENGGSGSVEAWFEPRHIWVSETILAFYASGNPDQFSLRQSLADLELKAERHEETSAAHLYVSNIFRQRGPVFIAIASGPHGTAAYANGVLGRMAPGFRLFTKNFTGRVIVGDSPRQPDSWCGQFLGLAIYGRELSAAQVERHYETWAREGRPRIEEGERNIALYLFNERSGNVVHNRAMAGVNLEIPEKYMVLDKVFLEPFWKEFGMTRSYWGAVVKNIIGFIPFGFCFCACLSAHKVRRAALATVALGALTSLTIEVLQAYLPTRDSGMTDIITNTLGTYAGAVAWKTLGPVLAERFPWLAVLAFSPV